ncbi:putative long-chain-fatty-acid--CoA ligase [Helianthus anomalus]
MQACNAHSLHCVPLYETLGVGAVKYIICHTEISIIFAEETKISEKQKQKQMAETCGLELYSWETFLHLVSTHIHILHIHGHVQCTTDEIT